MLMKTLPSTRQRTTTILKHILLFLIFYACLVYFLAKHSSLNPSSVFFDPLRAYESHYSIHRTKQAEAFIKSAWLHSKTSTDQDAIPNLCIGIPSRTHERARSLRTTIGSLLQGLTPEERHIIHLKVLIAEVDPLDHPAVHEPWLRHTVDEILFYNETLSSREIVRVVDLEKSAEFRAEAMQEKEVFDYTFLLRKCHESGAEYIAMLEDDVLAMDGWLHRSLKAVSSVVLEANLHHEEEELLSLSLFHSSPSPPQSPFPPPLEILASLLILTSLTAILYAIRKLKPHSPIGRNITFYSTFWICGIITPSFLLLYFAAGRSVMLPSAHGFVELAGPSHGSSQALIFPRLQAERLLKWSGEEKRGGSIETLLEDYAEKMDLGRWGIVPSVLQHVGRKPSWGDDGGGDVQLAETVNWDIEFEQYDVAALKKLHREEPAGELKGQDGRNSKRKGDS